MLSLTEFSGKMQDGESLTEFSGRFSAQKNLSEDPPEIFYMGSHDNDIYLLVRTT